MKEIRDQNLWHQLQNGNALAFRQLYDKHISALMGYGYKFTNNKQVIEDCCQELFIKIWEKRRELPYMDKPAKYLYAAFRNNLVKTLQRTENRYVAGVREELFELTPAADRNIIDSESEEIRKSQLQKAISSLPARQKEALYLKYQKGMEYDEICEIMEISYQSVRNLVSRALTNLRGLIGVGLAFLLKIIPHL